MYMYSTLARLVVKEEKKETPDPIHHTQTIQTHKHVHLYIITCTASFSFLKAVSSFTISLSFPNAKCAIHIVSMYA